MDTEERSHLARMFVIVLALPLRLCRSVWHFIFFLIGRRIRSAQYEYPLIQFGICDGTTFSVVCGKCLSPFALICRWSCVGAVTFVCVRIYMWIHIRVCARAPIRQESLLRSINFHNYRHWIHFMNEWLVERRKRNWWHRLQEQLVKYFCEHILIVISLISIFAIFNKHFNKKKLSEKQWNFFGNIVFVIFLTFSSSN